MMANSKKAVVLGGSGFLGSHLADILTDSDYNVVVFDKYNSPYINENQEMIVGDIIVGNLLFLFHL